jgi:hypothetical protein
MPEYVRLLFCHTCRSVDELPDYSGPVDHDYYLAHRVAQHQFSEGNPHNGILGRAENTPESIDAAISQMESMTAPGTGAGLGKVMYDLRDNYSAEAMQCWKRHNRTQNCDDYRTDKMRLWMDTRADRRAEGMTLDKNERPNIWLCDHCVVHSLVQQRQRKKAGLYE